MAIHISLGTAWENRDIIIKRCKKECACEAQFKRLLSAANETEFCKVLQDNIIWVRNHNILDVIKIGNKVKYNELAKIHISTCCHDKIGVVTDVIGRLVYWVILGENKSERCDAYWLECAE